MSNKWTILTEAALVVAMLTAGIAAAQAAHAAPLQTATEAADPRANVKIESKVLVERTEQDASGQNITTFFPPAEVTIIPGDQLIFVNSYHNIGSTEVTGFVINNPVHAAIAFTGVREQWAIVSVDGGANFGRLAELNITEQAENSETGISETITRAAQPGDVTHVRWVFDNAIVADASGELRFSGVVK